MTAVELGADICALASASVHADGVHVHAAETLDPAAFPGGGTFTLALRASRRKLKMPRRCRVVLWGVPEGAGRRDPAVKPRLSVLEGAGFRVERVVSPCNALAALARLKTSRGDGATCWIAVNRGGVAIVVVRPGKQIYSHSFTWDSTIGATGSQARLLQRYSLVAHLSPEVKRAMAAARQQGAPVESVVTCGNLPDLRSLTMPLIEELDVEVETLDSLDGLVVKKEIADRLAEQAPAIRLACAGAATRSSRPWDSSRRWKTRAERVLLYAATIAAGLAIGYAWYAWAHAQGPPASENRPQPPSPAKLAPPPPAQRGSDRGSAPFDPRQPSPTPVPPPRTQAPATVAPPPPSPTATSGTHPRPRPAPPLQSSEVPVDKPPARTAQPAVPMTAEQPRRAEPPASQTKLPARLADPVPRVATILVSGDRRYATVDNGQIVGIGDILGRRIVVGIDEQSVVFREPSGLQIRVGLGGRVLSVGPGGM